MSSKPELTALFQSISDLCDENNYELDALVEACDPRVKLAVVRWAMRHIVEHAEEGGSYRYLVYDRLGFGPEAYIPLCEDGMAISNEFDLHLKDNIIKAYRSGDEKELKSALGLCDEAGCFNYVSCGWPSNDGYRQTCSEHYIKEDK